MKIEKAKKKKKYNKDLSLEETTQYDKIEKEF